jgi:hypothetical protein
MPAEIFNDRYLGESAAWHRMGEVRRLEGVSATEAIGICRLNYKVGKYKVKYEIETPMGILLQDYPGQYVISRDPTDDDPFYQPFGVVGSDYHPIQNETIGKCLDMLTGTYPVESCGAISKGKGIFFALSAGTCEIRGAEMKKYFTVTDDKSGGSSLKIYYTPVVTVCKNTMVTGYKRAIVSAALNHYAGAGEDMKLRMELIGKLQQAEKETDEMFNKLASIALNANQVKRVIETAYPYPPRPKKASIFEEVGDSKEFTQFTEIIEQSRKVNEKWEWTKSRIDAYRADVEMRYSKFNDERFDGPNTGWGLFNAVVESADYRVGVDESVAENSLLGNRAKEKKLAFAALMGEM